MRKIWCVLFGVLVCGVQPGHATNYWVATTGNDANNGLTTGTAWLTIAKAAATAVAGDVVTVRNGTYVSGQIQFAIGGTINSPVTFQAENNQQAIISSTSSCNPTIRTDADYITLDGFRLTVDATDVLCQSGTTANYYIQLWPPSVAKIEGPTSTPAKGGVVKNFLFDYHNGHRFGDIKIGQDDAVIENNVLHGELEVFNNNNTIVRNNTVSSYTHGIIVKGGARNTQVYNNVVHLLDATFSSGIIAGGCTGDAFFWDTTAHIESYNTAVYNNVIVNDSASNTNTGIRFRSSSNSTAFNNVIINVEPFEFSLSCATTPPSSANPTLLNNIALDIAGGTSYAMGDVSVYSGTLTLDYNNIYGYSNTHSQTHAISGDPLFVNNLSDWHLQAGSPARAAGTVVSLSAYPSGSLTVYADPDGTARPGSGWDAGAYQTPVSSGGSGGLDVKVPSAPTMFSVRK